MKALRLQCFQTPSRGRSLGIGLLVVIVFSIQSVAPIRGEDVKPAPAGNFSEILDRQTRKTFDAIQNYIKDHPEADDAEQAYKWLFQTASEQAWESEAVSLADLYLKQAGKELPLKDSAARVRMVGRAKAGQWDEAMLDFERQLANVRFRMPDQTVDLAKTLAVQAQIAGKPETAREIYQNLSRTLFLNANVRLLCETKLAKLDLIGQSAPKSSVTDLNGKAVDWKDYREKWVLVDFWATNCPPCLKEFPRLKQFYEKRHPQGLEIVGISLDEKQDTVEEFQKTWNLPWSLALSSGDNDATRDRFRVPTIPAMYLINPQGQVELIDPNVRELEQFFKKK